MARGNGVAAHEALSTKREETRSVALLRVTLALPMPVVQVLERLRQLGIYGVTIEDVAERLISGRLTDRHVLLPRWRIGE